MDSLPACRARLPFREPPGFVDGGRPEALARSAFVLKCALCEGKERGGADLGVVAKASAQECRTSARGVCVCVRGTPGSASRQARAGLRPARVLCAADTSSKPRTVALGLS